MTITLIRHTSVDVPSGICYGQSDVDVSVTFEAEAEVVLSNLKNKQFDAVFCSPAQRCRKLASYCGFPEAVIDDRLMELNFGKWEMKAWNEINDPQLQRWYNNWLDEAPTNGESYKAMTHRVAEFLKEVQTQNHQQIAIFTHAGVIRSLAIIIKGISASEAFDYKVEYGDARKIIINS